MHVTVEFSIQEAPNLNIDFDYQSALLHRLRVTRKDSFNGRTLTNNVCARYPPSLQG